MTDDNNTTAGLDQADEDILSYTVSDEALEAAAGTEGGGGGDKSTDSTDCGAATSCLLRINSP